MISQISSDVTYPNKEMLQTNKRIILIWGIQTLYYYFWGSILIVPTYDYKIPRCNQLLFWALFMGYYLVLIGTIKAIIVSYIFTKNRIKQTINYYNYIWYFMKYSKYVELVLLFLLLLGLTSILQPSTVHCIQLYNLSIWFITVTWIILAVIFGLFVIYYIQIRNKGTYQNQIDVI